MLSGGTLLNGGKCRKLLSQVDKEVCEMRRFASELAQLGAKRRDVRRRGLDVCFLFIAQVGQGMKRPLQPLQLPAGHKASQPTCCKDCGTRQPPT